jgi:hypothetical protein
MSLRRGAVDGGPSLQRRLAEVAEPIDTALGALEPAIHIVQQDRAGSHSCTLAMSASWSSALVDPVARSACAPCAWVGEIGEPLDLGRHVRELVKLGGGRQPVAGGDLGGKLVVHGALVPIIDATCPNAETF